MLPRPHRVRTSEEFRHVLRRGRRAGRRRLSVHAVVGHGPSRAGFVVGRTVGVSVVRHRVTRRLRHLVATRLPELPEGASLVVRAHPAAAGASSDDLGADLDGALRSLGLLPARSLRVIAGGAGRSDDDR